MVSILKNQIIKHLSAFARNLTPDQISLEVLRGNGELRNIQLNEQVLSERLELPPWLKIRKAICSRIRVEVSWTKLKTTPVKLYIDEIHVTLQLLSPEPKDEVRHVVAASTAKAYDLAERVLEGLSLYVLSVDIQFESEHFGGSLTFSQFSLESKSPGWKDESNLHKTRIHDKKVRQILFWKQCRWVTLRIEASAYPSRSESAGDDAAAGMHQPPAMASRRRTFNSPLRLITENGKIRIAIKKNDMDCSVIAGRIEVIIDDIFWVSTLLHLRSAIDFYKHIKELANAVPKPPPKVDSNPFLTELPYKPSATPSPSSTQSVHHPHPRHSDISHATQAFQHFNIHQSSHHLYIGKIDMNLYDDSSAERFPADWNVMAGAIQMTLGKLKVDYYPNHQVFNMTKAGSEFSERRDWIRYNGPNAFTELAKRQLKQHLMVIGSELRSDSHERFMRQWPRLCSQNVVIRVEDIVVQCVSEQTTKREHLQNMFQQRKQPNTQLPSSMCFFQLEFASYHFPSMAQNGAAGLGVDSKASWCPTPRDSTHLVVGPSDILVDYKTIRWLVYVFENILNAWEAPEVSDGGADDAGCDEGPDVRVEFVMPRVELLPCPEPIFETLADTRLPQRFLLNVSTLAASNFILMEDPAVPLPVPLLNGVDQHAVEFVEELSERVLDAGVHKQLEEKSRPLSKDNALLSLNLHKHNEWYIFVPTLWLSCDFGPGSYEVVLVNDVTLAGCLIQRSAHLSVLLEPRTDVSVTVDHFQLLQLIQLQTKVAEMLDLIDIDRHFFATAGERENLQETPLAVFAHVDRVQLKLVLPVGAVPSPYDAAKLGDEDSPGSSTDTSSSLAGSDLLPGDNTTLGAPDGSYGPHDEEDGVATPPSSSSAVTTPGHSRSLGRAHHSPSSRIPTSVTGTNLPIASSPTPNLTVMQLAVNQSASMTNMAPATFRQPSPTNSHRPTVKPPPGHVADGALPTEIHPSRRQVSQFPDFTNPAFGVDLSTTVAEFPDDTMSVTTTLSDTERQFQLLDISQLGGGGVDDDIFTPSESVVVAEEAAAMDDEKKAYKARERYFNKQVNAFDILLQNTNVYLASKEGKTTAVGYTAAVHVGERLKCTCRDVYNEKGVVFDGSEADGAHVNISSKEAQVRFELHSRPRQAEIRAAVRGLDIRLSDEVLSQLGPFIEDPTPEVEHPPQVEIKLEDCRVEVKNPQTPTQSISVGHTSESSAAGAALSTSIEPN